MSEVTAAISRIQSLQESILSTRHLVSGGFEALLSQAMGATAAPAGSVSGLSDPTAGLDRMVALKEIGSGAKNFVLPVDGEVTSEFGPRTHPVTGAHGHHDGIDIAAPTGTPIAAAAGGTVSYAGVMGGYGNVVIIDHPNGLQTLYAHQSRISVTVGQKVSAGQAIGAVGSTGMSTGPHLHFEVKRDGEAIDPRPFLF